MIRRPSQAARRAPTLGRGAAVTLILAIATLWPAPARAQAPPAASEELEDTRAVLEKYIETRRAISKEKQEWTLGREMLEDQIALRKRQIESLRAEISAAEQSVTELDQKKAELAERKETLGAAATTLGRIVGSLEARTQELLIRLPEPLQDRIRPLSQRFPDDPDDTKLNLSQRFQNVVGILNEINKFNGEIVTVSEVRALGDGRKAEVTAIYVGIGQSYYVTARGDAAGFGTSSPQGWVWTPADELADEIARAIAILQNEASAAFVPLPIRIQ